MSGNVLHDGCGGACKMSDGVLWCQRCGDEDDRLHSIRVREVKSFEGTFGRPE